MRWKPSVESFGALLSLYMREAASLEDDSRECTKDISPAQYYRSVVQLYEDVLLRQNEEMGMDIVDVDVLLKTPKTLLVILQAIVALDKKSSGGSERTKLRSMATFILQLECFQNENNLRLLLTANGRMAWQTKEAFHMARSWPRSV